MKIGHPHPIGREAVDVGRGVQFATIAAQITIPQVVRQDVDDVWSVGRRRQRRIAIAAR